jgi:excisionase family DNA binding protein
MPTPELITVREAVERLDRSKTAVYEMCAAGILRSERVGGRMMIDASSLPQ